MEQQELDLSVADGYVVTRTDEEDNHLCYIQHTPADACVPAIFFKNDDAQRYANYLHSLHPDCDYKVTSFAFATNGVPTFGEQL